MMLRALVAALLLVFAAPPAAAQAPAPPAPASRALDKADLDAWLDGLVPYAMATGDIAGTVVVVVKDGRVLTERGYGWADVKARRPVDPAATLFRVGSISKPFTWTAVMQLVEQGRIDLDADVNRYVDFHVRAHRGRPVTMRQLMTHTAGFEEHLKDLFTDDRRRLLTLEQYVKRWQPPRVFTPGEVPAYSNYGAALAGYVVERVSGEPFDTYVERHIFGPLGMARSTFRQPLPATFEPHMARAYMRASGPPKPYELVNARPAGSVSTTGADMARYMIAMLDGGRLGDAQVLDPATTRAMFAEQRKHTPPLNAMALGFYREDRNGRAIVGHAGATEGFYADMHLMLSERVGLFVAMNSAGREAAASRIQRMLFTGFMDRYYPSTAPRLPTTPTARTHGQALAGYYAPTRRMKTSFFAATGFLRQTHVTFRPDSAIVVDAIRSPSGAPRVWREIGPWLWEDETGSVRLAAVVEEGRVVAYATDGAPPVNLMQRLPAPQVGVWKRQVITAALAVLAAAVVLWPIQAVVRWRYKAPFALAGRRAWLHRLVRLGAAVQLLAVWACLNVFGRLQQGLTRLDDRLDAPIRIAQALCIAGLFATALAAVNTIVIWRDPAAGWGSKASATLILAASLVFAWAVLTLGVLASSTQF